MKKKTILITILFVLFCLPYYGMAQPKALIDDPIFTFEAVPEGVHVSHEFIIKNTGVTLLHIENVLPP
ncbi:MAG: DUF1573 domain-containing protein [Proteobacteria bacterium]|nr:DUF1573 domain-containing protein [Pseudomonadota bacterium]MBU1583867.1 DUF1573 domain-containing protein [Pseudomonadota bacterium]MBU2629584.1 DUF1573 domain-containing protein [Pseudomonadota bacterium]